MEAKRRTLLPNPSLRASFLSFITFFYSYNVVKRALKKILFIRDLWKPLGREQSDNLGSRLEKHWRDLTTNHCRWRLPRALIRLYLPELISISFFMTILTIGIRVVVPLIIRPTMAYFATRDRRFFQLAIHCASAYFYVLLGMSLFGNYLLYRCFNAGLQMQTAIWSLLHRKALRLPITSMKKDIVKYVRKGFLQDISRLDVLTLYLLYLWSAPFLVVSIGVIMYHDIGYASLPGLVIIILMVPARKLLKVCRYKLFGHLGNKTEVRYLKTKEVFDNIEIVKKHAWANRFESFISKLRKKERKIIQSSIFQHAIHTVLMIFTSRLALLATIVTAIILQERLNFINTFVYLFYFDNLTIIVTQIITRALSQYKKSFIYLREIEKYLDLEEIHPKQAELRKKHENEKEYAVFLKNVDSTWDKSDKKTAFMLKGVKLNLEKGSLVCLIGPPKSGKTSLLHTILQNMHITHGTINAKGPFGYAPQTPWIFSSTIRQNIMFGSNFMSSRYNKVLKNCALIPDLCAMTDGDLKILKEDETVLTDGQKLRINLARAVYREADVYIFDDNLSQLPPSMQRFIFNTTIGPQGMLKDALRILVTNDKEFINQSNMVIAMNENGFEDCGETQKIMSQERKYIKPVNKNARRKWNRDQKSLSEEYCGNNMWPGVKSQENIYDNELDSEDVVDFEGDGYFNIEYSSGRYDSFVRYIKEGAESSNIMILSIAFIVLYAIIAASDIWLTFWITLEVSKFKLQNTTGCINSTDINCTISEMSKLYVKHSKVIYEVYDHVKGGLKYPHRYQRLAETAPCLIVYLNYIGVTLVLAAIINIFFSKICLKANKNLHDTLLHKMTSARISFYQRTRTEKILNLFKNDIKIVDNVVPTSLLESINLFLWITGWALTAVYANSYITIYLVSILVLFFIAQCWLLITTKRLKQLQDSMKSKLSRRFGAALDAMSIIRAFKVEGVVQRDFDDSLNSHSSTKQTFFAVSSAFSVILETVSVISIGIIIYETFHGTLRINGNLMTFTIMQLAGFTGMLGWSLKQTAASSNELTSVERIMKYCNAEQEEDPPKPEKIRRTWPECGRIVYKEMSLSYEENGEDVIKNISFNFGAREKVGIVGESGAGKSSFVNAIVRMGHVKGLVEIDRTDTSRITLEDLRSHITTLTRKPAIFSGTIRSNLDLYNEYRQDDIIYALKAVKLDSLDLNMVVDHNGENLTFQQRHLLAFARAVLYNNRIIILDEALSDLDDETLEIVKDVLDDYLDESTIFHITKQLEHVMYSDCILVIEKGVLVENGLPYHLLQRNGGEFKKMVHSYKKVSPAELIEIANLKVINHPYLKIE
ncbi:ATP-binding cassette sub-family C member 4-like [Lutzomyia longipalpis]|uniref:ATP-binding cassette sub-family C member 4-like n=1 Tax=Lutzomyia longipalpis TaxID=7200 RepID=UPI0024837078|nr:ATP-binding cassette sub-family C member 4-like [Lutzomyia longipalpis]